MYQNCIFDLYGTLVDIRTDESGEKFWGEIADVYTSYGAKYTSNEICDAYYKIAKRESNLTHITHPLYKHIEIELRNVFKRLYKRKGVNASNKIIDDTALKFRKASTEFICLYDGVIDLLESLKKAGKKIYLLSNAQRCFTYPELEELGIVNYFDGIFISSDCGCKKPQKAFFDKLFKQFSLKKSESIMVGNDCITDMMGAKEAGIDGLYIHQEISTPLEGKKLVCNYKIMDGDVTKIKNYLLKA
ncbi:MAG: HAD family hydrolase [Ruminococcus sp.]|nr:HAD family hydrolase [Ruminococcus sp.]